MKKTTTYAHDILCHNFRQVQTGSWVKLVNDPKFSLLSSSQKDHSLLQK